MTSQKLYELFARHAEDAQFQLRAKATPEVRFVYAYEYGTIWKFTPIEWWRFVTKAVRNQGNPEFLLSKALRRRPKHVTESDDRKILSSSDDGIRCVNPLNWTVEDWTKELIRA
jgi:hypothetical protein